MNCCVLSDTSLRADDGDCDLTDRASDSTCIVRQLYAGQIWWRQ